MLKRLQKFSRRARQDLMVLQFFDLQKSDPDIFLAKFDELGPIAVKKLVAKSNVSDGLYLQVCNGECMVRVIKLIVLCAFLYPAIF